MINAMSIPRLHVMVLSVSGEPTLINIIRRLRRGPEVARKARGHFYNSGYRNFPEELA
jgi:hypothetical protein